MCFQSPRCKWLQQSNVALDFHLYFWNQYGGERWKSLFSMLPESRKVVAFCNPFAENKGMEKSRLSEYLGVYRGSRSLDIYSEQLSQLWIVNSAQQHAKIKKDKTSKLKSFYWIDPASFLPPVLLNVQPNHKVLDMCAAPGGKSLVLASLMFQNQSGNEGRLICNEVDPIRQSNLERVLHEYIPHSAMLFSNCISVGRRDGARYWGRFEKESFDRVLVDAPCTTERHVAQRAARDNWGSIPESHWSFQMCNEHVPSL
eukprot:TRINITY_DN18743_c0_g1_i2.p2 TRINITY_DN18743_c0_g1~~TRINITY_DN18743_c0_g1_i2.p2  ORF type:complete len:257 (-),score=13.09 TRINITY_DN18743_c0_g1_i2:69-839(-)